MQKRFSLMILDDEPAICSLIASLIQWETLEIDFAGEAYDGIEALAKIREKQPDIVITDIQMPGMDGLELIRSAQAEGIFPAFLIVSGYSKFEYAKKAIEYKVEDYLLKPIKKAELNHLLERIQERLSRERREQEKQIERLAHQENTLLRRWEREIYRWLETPGGNWETILKNIHGEDFFAGGYSDLFCGIWKGLLGQDDGETLDQIRRHIGETCEDAGIDTTFFTWKGGVIWLGKTQRKMEQEEWKSIVKEISDDIHSKRQEGWTFVISPPMISLAELGNAMDQIWKQVCVRRTGQGTVIFWVPENKAERISLSPESRTELFLCLDALNEGGIPDWIFRTLHREAWPPSRQPEAYGLALEIIQDAERKMRPLWEEWSDEEKRELPFSYEKFGAELSESGSLEELTAVIEKNLVGMIHSIRENRERREIKTVREAKEYLQKNYAKGISLEDVARHVMLAPTYLSLLFKQETGKNYNEYLTDLRMEAAKELLCTTRLGVEHIANQIGYTDAKYFSKLFTKRVGIRPKEYRRLYS
ncbi:response regulator [Hominifimenecus sp. rT4P-3]|uniref:response regulator n=1 Tax=Hominifimenecus sp. rT4P-3 TaxID=3242979 RepID=UPI003DA437C4